MKVLHLIEHYLPPSQVWLYHLLSQSRAHEHHIATLKFEPTNFYDQSFFFTESRLSSYRQYISTLYRNRLFDVIKRIALLPAEWIVGDELEQWSDYIKTHGIEVIHAHFAPMGCRFATLAQSTGKPLVVSFYGYDYESLPRQMPRYVALYQKLFEQADYFLCEGPFGAETLIKKGCNANKIIVQPLNTNHTNIPFVARQRLPGRFRLVQIADLTEKKGQLFAIQAFARARAVCPGLSLTLVGGARSSTYFEEVMQCIKNLGLSESIRILPFIPFDELFTFLADFDAFIHPSCQASNGDCEGGAPIVLLDAQATGLPIITTKHCDIPYVVVPDQTALVCAEKDVEELAGAIQRLYEMPPDDFTSMSINARRWVEERSAQCGIDYAKLLCGGRSF